MINIIKVETILGFYKGVAIYFFKDKQLSDQYIVE